jgi:hypothetical protein
MPEQSLPPNNNVVRAKPMDSDQVVCHRLCTSLGKLLIVSGGAGRIGVPRDNHFLDIIAQQRAMQIQRRDDIVNLRLELRRQFCAVEGKLHVTDDNPDQLDFALSKNFVATLDRGLVDHCKLFFSTDFLGNDFFRQEKLLAAFLEVFVGVLLSGAHASACRGLHDILAGCASHATLDGFGR